LLKGKKYNHTSSGSWKSMPQGIGNPKPIFLEVRPPPPSPSLETGRGLRSHLPFRSWSEGEIERVLHCMTGSRRWAGFRV
jgi:hypothetical protein